MDARPQTPTGGATPLAGALGWSSRSIPFRDGSWDAGCLPVRGASPD